MRRLFNEGWRFLKAETDSAYAAVAGRAGETVCLPHDWAIAEPVDFYRDADGWYIKELDASLIPAEHERVFLRFDGVYMDCRVYLNGWAVAEHHYGYTAFSVPLDGLRPGTNEIAVQVRYRCPNSRWYSGAGIFRDVELWSFRRGWLPPDGISLRTAREGGNWRLDLYAEALGAAGQEVGAALYDGERCLWRDRAAADEKGVSLSAVLSGVSAWSPDMPKLYTLELTLMDQKERVRIGFRETRFTPDDGFYLNGERVKLRGVCLHHDLGALGAAFHPDAARRQLRLMKAMGANAIRTSHNPPASAFLDLCDEMGLLVDDEAYDMWELPKTRYDNARFFPDTWREDVASWIRRDRCHPSVVMWSIGNEIHDVFLGEQGYRWTLKLTEEARLHDRFGHARVTFGSNYMPWEGAQRAANYVKLAGYNYAEAHYAAHHRAHPDWIIYGSETASMVQSRGVYHFPMGEDILAEEDLQCSALLNSKTSWGTQSLQKMLAEDRTNAYSLGQFIWAGIDYIGEPTPYQTKNSYFGQADTACFPKDTYYFYQAMWSGEPMIHIGVRWKWNPGQPVDVPVMTSCASAELLLNGVSLGVKRVDLDNEAACLPVWQVPYQDGTLEARGYDADGRLIVRDVRHSYGAPVKLTLRAEETVFRRGGLAFLTVGAEDADGHPVEDANLPVRVAVRGPGCLMGLDNGDSTDDTPYQTDTKRLFSGKLLAVVGAEDAGEIGVSVSAPGLQEADIVLRAAETADAGPLPTVRVRRTEQPAADWPWIRRIGLAPRNPRELTPEAPSADFSVVCEPEHTERPITLRVTNAQGVDFPGAKAEWLDGHTARVTAWADGRFWLRAAAKNGAEHTRVLSVYPVTARGFGALTLDPYRLVSGSLSDVRVGEISPGNEQGIAFAREGFSGVGFSRVDFGPVGSDRLELPIFALDANPHDIGLWDGRPEAGGRKLMTCRYQKPSVWNTYQSETYTLPEPLTGLHDLFFSAVEKVHFKGFRFERQSRALRVNAGASADAVYGDSYRISDGAVLDIGNNVTLVFENMDFSGDGYSLALTGHTPNTENPILLVLRGEDGGETKQSLVFPGGEGVTERRFTVRPPAGRCRVEFIFLPGSRFDLHSFRFEKENT